MDGLFFKVVNVMPIVFLLEANENSVLYQEACVAKKCKMWFQSFCELYIYKPIILEYLVLRVGKGKVGFQQIII